MVLLIRAKAVATPSRIPLLTACCSLALVSALSGCGGRPAADAPLGAPPRRTRAESAASLEARRQQALKRCLAGRDTLENALAALRRDEARLARLRAERFVPETAPPAFDENDAARLTREDAELDRERHESALSQWRERHAERLAAWQADQPRRLAEAQAALDRQAAELRARHPRLFSEPGSIEVVPAELARLSRCELPPAQAQKRASR